MITMQMGDENVIDPGEPNFIFPHLGLGSFSAIDQKKPPGYMEYLGGWISV
jgi:hypothetical protein